MDLWIQILYINALKYQPNISFLRGVYIKRDMSFIVNTTAPQTDSVQSLIDKIHLDKQCDEHDHKDYIHTTVNG